MDTVLSSTENYVERPYVVRLYEDAFEKGYKIGFEEGFEKAILVFWKKNSDWTAEQMADTFEISVEKAKQLQLTVTSGTE
jgi:hypothetical protein